MDLSNDLISNSNSYFEKNKKLQAQNYELKDKLRATKL